MILTGLDTIFLIINGVIQELFWPFVGVLVALLVIGILAWVGKRG